MAYIEEFTSFHFQKVCSSVQERYRASQDQGSRLLLCCFTISTSIAKIISYPKQMQEIQSSFQLVREIPQRKKYMTFKGASQKHYILLARTQSHGCTWLKEFWEMQSSYKTTMFISLVEAEGKMTTGTTSFDCASQIKCVWFCFLFLNKVKVRPSTRKKTTMMVSNFQ